MVIGSHPYPDHIVPFLGSSYSQEDDTVDTPTTRIIAQHFDDDEELQSHANYGSKVDKTDPSAVIELVIGLSELRVKQQRLI